MISKELFIKCINTIKVNRERENKFIEGLSVISPHTYCDVFLYGDYESILIDLLTELFNDKTETLCWWIDDTDFGVNNPSFTEDDKEYCLDTTEKLYEYLANQGEKYEQSI